MSEYEKESLEKELEKMHETAQKTVLGFVTSTSATSAIPIPLADMPMLVGQQVVMLAAINKIYKLDVSKNKLNTLVLAVLGTGGTALVGRTLATGMLKMIPGVGSVAGGVISVSTAGLLTLALGNAYIEVCEAVKKGELAESAISKKEGMDFFKKGFKKYFKKEEDSKKAGNEAAKEDCEKTTDQVERNDEDDNEEIDFEV